MGKFILCVSLFLIFGAVATFAEIELESEHGEDLTKAGFVIRYKFKNEVGKDWSKSSYDERLEFLTAWYAVLEQDRLLQEEQTKQEAEELKLKAQQKEETRRRKEERIKKKLELEEQAKEFEEDRMDRFKEAVEATDQKIEDLRRNQRKSGD